MPGKSQQTHGPEVPVFCLVPEEVHGRQRSDRPAEEGDPQQDRLPDAPLVSFGPPLVDAVKQDRREAQHPAPDEKQVENFHGLAPFLCVFAVFSLESSRRAAGLAAFRPSPSSGRVLFCAAYCLLYGGWSLTSLSEGGAEGTEAEGVTRVGILLPPPTSSAVRLACKPLPTGGGGQGPLAGMFSGQCFSCRSSGAGCLLAPAPGRGLFKPRCAGRSQSGDEDEMQTTERRLFNVPVGGLFKAALAAVGYSNRPGAGPAKDGAGKGRERDLAGAGRKRNGRRRVGPVARGF